MLKKLLTTLLLAASLSLSVQAATITGTVTTVSDGDTVTIMADGQKFRVHLNGIDAPESQQRGGAQSRNHLAALINSNGGQVTVNYQKKDRYGRILGKLLSNGVDLNLEQLNAGHAWVYRKYMGDLSYTDQKAYLAAESNARQERIGLWQEKNPTPPWDWRKAKRR